MAERTDAQLCRTMQTVQRASRRRDAWRQLLDRHQGLVRKLSYKYVSPGFSHSDAFQQAILGFRYSAMSYDPSKAQFNTHIGWGVMKYCMMLRDDSVKHQYEKAASQSQETDEQYQQAAVRDQRRLPRLTVQGYQKLLKAVRPLGVNREEEMVLGLAYRVGNRDRQRKWRRRLWHMWLERKIRTLCTRIERKKVEAN